jgi:hypothetical protein
MRDSTQRERTVIEAVAARYRLRVDKVAIRLIERLQATLGNAVPEGLIVLVTVTAPIRLPAKTASSLEERIQTLLARGSPRRDVQETIHGNGVRIRFWRGKPALAPRLMGFVHNPDSDARRLLDVACESLHTC